MMTIDAGVAQLVECLLPKQDVAGSIPVLRSKPGFGQVFSDGTDEWSVPRLIELATELVPEQVPLSEFKELDEVVWSDEAMTVREVLEHTRRILDADLTCPVILSADGWIMDGCHRLAKAHLLGRDTLLAVRFDNDPPPDRPTGP